MRGEMWLRLKLDVRLVRPLGARKCALIGRELLHEPGESTGERERNGDGERGVRVGEVEVEPSTSASAGASRSAGGGASFFFGPGLRGMRTDGNVPRLARRYHAQAGALRLLAC